MTTENINLANKPFGPTNGEYYTGYSNSTEAQSNRIGAGLIGAMGTSSLVGRGW